MGTSILDTVKNSVIGDVIGGAFDVVGGALDSAATLGTRTLVGTVDVVGDALGYVGDSPLGKPIDAVGDVIGGVLDTSPVQAVGEAVRTVLGVDDYLGGSDVVGGRMDEWHEIVGGRMDRWHEIVGADPWNQIIGANVDPTVLAIQQALLAQGFSVGKSGADGVFGKDTQAAIQKFMASKGISHSGIIDAQVLSLLGAASAPATPPSGQPQVAPSTASGLPNATPIPLAVAVAPSDSFWSRPLWAGAPVKTGHAAIGAGVLGAAYYWFRGRRY